MKTRKKKAKKKIVTGKRGISLRDRYAVIDLKQAVLLIEATALEMSDRLTKIIRKENYWNREELETIASAKIFSSKFRRP